MLDIPSSLTHCALLLLHAWCLWGEGCFLSLLTLDLGAILQWLHPCLQINYGFCSLSLTLGEPHRCVRAKGLTFPWLTTLVLRERRVEGSVCGSKPSLWLLFSSFSPPMAAEALSRFLPSARHRWIALGGDCNEEYNLSACFICNARGSCLLRVVLRRPSAMDFRQCSLTFSFSYSLAFRGICLL